MNEEQLKLTRHNLSLIDSFDLTDEMTEQERKTYCANISAVWKDLEKDILKAIQEQMVLTFKTADNMDKIALGQGAVNGMNVLFEKWQRANVEHSENIKPEE